MALAAARDLPQLSLPDALELTILVARNAGRHPRVAARWLLRYLEEDPHATIVEAVLAGSSLAALARSATRRRRRRCGGCPKERLAGGGHAT